MDYDFKIEHFQSLDSTSSYLQRRPALFNGSPDTDQWQVCSADYQTAGRGQRGNSWSSSSKSNLLFSILFHPSSLPASRQFVLTEIFSLAMVDFFNSLGVGTSIKWPNDIYAGNNKICGMLFENSISDGAVSSSIVGIGVNLNQREFGSSIANPTSVALETGCESDRQDSLVKVLGIIRSRYENFVANGFPYQELHKEYQSKLYRNEGYHKFQRLAPGLDPLNVSFACNTLNNVFEARIAGVKENGLLVLENREGLQMEFAFKEVKFLL